LCCLYFLFWPLCCLYFLFWPLCCLYFDLRLVITLFVSSNICMLRYVTCQQITSCPKCRIHIHKNRFFNFLEIKNNGKQFTMKKKSCYCYGLWCQGYVMMSMTEQMV
jgi:hypothetical protein